MNENIRYYIGNYEPTIKWQVGHSNKKWNNYKFIITVRPIEEGGISNQILYQESGIALNSDNIGEWKFTSEKKKGIEIRDYNIVIEAHDEDGHTSAGNQIDYMMKNYSNSDSYISIFIKNERR